MDSTVGSPVCLIQRRRGVDMPWDPLPSAIAGIIVDESVRRAFFLIFTIVHRNTVDPLSCTQSQVSPDASPDVLRSRHSICLALFGSSTVLSLCGLALASAKPGAPSAPNPQSPLPRPT